MNKTRLKELWAILLTKNSHSTKKILRYASIKKIHPMTIRRDLHELEKYGLIKLNYNNIEVLNSNIDPFSNLKDVKIKNMSAKEMMSKKVIGLLNDEDIIFVGSGTTCHPIARNINKKIKILFSNGLTTIAIASKNPYINEKILIGGSYNEEIDSFTGSLALSELEKFHFSKLIITCDNIDKFGNVYIKNSEEAGFLIKILKNSNNKILVADATKFNTNGIYKIANISSFNEVITDSSELK